MKKGRVSALCVAALAAVLGWCWLRMSGPSKTPPKRRWNVLVVSACSLRNDRLGVYNPSSRLTPRLDAWAAKATVFSNAIAERPWQNFTFEGRDVITRRFLGSRGYRDFLERDSGYNFYVPPVEVNAAKQIWYWSENAVLDFHEGLGELKAALEASKGQPFYIFTHLKYMHYPYLDTVNFAAADWNKLSPRSRELLRRYRAHPERHSTELPLIEVLTNSFDLVKKELRAKDVYAVAGVVSDRARAAAWRGSPDYADGLRLAEELYDLKMTKFDEMAAQVLDLFGDKELQDNTVVVFTGDHGEAFMEHGVLGHSVNVYDEMLRYPLIVKFPGQTQSFHVDGQVDHLLMAQLVREIITGELGATDFATKAQARAADFVLSRNCPDTIRSVRFKAEWKLIKNLATGRDELYDLKADPSESKNLIEAQPAMAWKLEEYMIDHLADLQRENTNGRHAQVCTAN